MKRHEMRREKRLGIKRGRGNRNRTFSVILATILFIGITSVVGAALIIDESGNFAAPRLPWHTSHGIPQFASSDDYGCPHAEGKEKSVTVAPTTERLETHLQLDMSEANGGQHYLIDLVTPADEIALLTNGDIKTAQELVEGDVIHLTGESTGVVKSVETELYTPKENKTDANGRVLARVVGKSERWTDELLYIHTAKETIKTTPEHPFLVNGEWVEAKDIQPNDDIETKDTSTVKVKKTELVTDPQFVYNLHVEGAHTFFVGEDELLTHNSDCFPKLNQVNRAANAAPWQMTKENTGRVMRHDTYGKFYQHDSTGLWWSKDNAGHGGSAWKVFEKDGNKLNWVADADEYGDFIIGKHKGETGLTIPWKQMNGSNF